MFSENTLRQAISTIESYHSLDRMVDEKEIAQKLRIGNTEKFREFCSDYDDIRDQRKNGVWLTNRQFSDHKFSFYRTVRNGALSAILGLFVDPQLYGALGMAGAGMAVTAYDETTNKGTMNLGNVWLSILLGGFIGSFFGEGETGKYVGAGIGAALSTAYEAQQGLRRRVTPDKPKEEVLQGIEEQYKGNVDSLLAHYTS